MKTLDLAREKIADKDKIIRAMAEDLKDSSKCDFCDTYSDVCGADHPCPTTDEIIKHFTEKEKG